MNLLLVLFFSFHSESQAQVGEWESHTSFRQVVSIASSEEALWVATTGGVYSYTLSEGLYTRYTPTRGLFNVSSEALAYNAVCNCVWVGYNSGTLDRIDVETGVVRTFRDIERAEQFPSRKVNKLLVSGDSLFVATNFGVVLFDTNLNEVRDSYTQLGTFTPGIAVQSILIAPDANGVQRIWLAAAEGIAHAPLGSPNLQDPSVWTSERLNSINGVDAMASLGGVIYVGTPGGVFRRGIEGGFTSIGGEGMEVRDMIALEDQIVGVHPSVGFSINASGQYTAFGSPRFEDLQAITTGPGGSLWFGDGEQGSIELLSLSPATISEVNVIPEGPIDGTFTDLAVDDAGNLWGGGDRGFSAGFYKKNIDGSWISYSSRFFDDFIGKRTTFRRIHVDAEGNAWAGSNGGGLVQVTPENEIVFFDQTNSSLRKAEGTPDESFVLVRGIASEGDGTLWVGNTNALDPLSVRTPDGNWMAHTISVSSQLTPDRIYIDSFNQKWMLMASTRNLERIEGVAVLDSGEDPFDDSDFEVRLFNTQGRDGQGLPGTFVNSIAEDKNGLVWVGTQLGLAYFVNNGIVARDENATPIWPINARRQEGESQYLFFGLSINDLAVDSANRLWVGTNEGLWVVQEAGTGFEIVEQFTVENSPLFSNTIVSVAVDNRSGVVYVATDAGLLSYASETVAPVEQIQDLVVYPNPIRITTGETASVFIEGLIDATDLKILTANGTLVRSFSTRGGRVQWDTRDEAGNQVPSGVYLVVAIGKNGEGTAYGKIAVIL